MPRNSRSRRRRSVSRGSTPGTPCTRRSRDRVRECTSRGRRLRSSSTRRSISRTDSVHQMLSDIVTRLSAIENQNQRQLQGPPRHTNSKLNCDTCKNADIATPSSTPPLRSQSTVRDQVDESQTVDAHHQCSRKVMHLRIKRSRMPLERRYSH